MRGIYSLKIGEKYYIGKDFYISMNKRLKEHLRMLDKNCHYNTYLQNAYNKYKNYEYSILLENDDITGDELSKEEIKYIQLYDSYNNGYNLTMGGEGLSGFKFNEKTCESRSNMYVGEKNPLSKLSNAQFFEVVEMLKDGLTNKEIADKYNLHDRYVSLIRHKKRFKKLWEQVDNYEPIVSSGNSKHRGISEDSFKEIVYMIKCGATNAQIERKYNLSGGTGSRIRHKKLYKQWWKEFFNED